MHHLIWCSCTVAMWHSRAQVNKNFETKCKCCNVNYQFSRIIVEPSIFNPNSRSKIFSSLINTSLSSSLTLYNNRARVTSLLVATAASVYAIDNGKGITPSRGWRSWNLFGANVDQQLIMSQMTAIANRSRMVDGKIQSLCDLGYCDVGLDDNWQLCSSYGPNKYSYHDANGRPVVNHARFPDFIAMTDYAHSLGLTAGWCVSFLLLHVSVSFLCY